MTQRRAFLQSTAAGALLGELEPGLSEAGMRLAIMQERCRELLGRAPTVAA